MSSSTTPFPTARIARRLLVGFLLACALLMIGAGAAHAETLKAKRVDRGVTVVGKQFPPRAAGKIVYVKQVRRAGTVVKGPRRSKVVRSGPRGGFRVLVKAKKSFKGRVRVRAVLRPVKVRSTLSVAAAKPVKNQGRTKNTTDTTSPTTPTPPAPTDPTLEPGRYGVDASFVPAYDVEVRPGNLTQALVDAHPAGTRFGLTAGTHRLPVRIRPRPNQQFLGYPGAVLNGSKVLTSFTREGSWWVAGGQTQRLMRHGICEGSYTGCQYAEDVYIDHKPLWQVTSLSQLAPGRFFFDYANSRIYLADDPTGRLVETSVADAAIYGQRADGTRADGVSVVNLVVEKFGSPAQNGAINGMTSRNWTVRNNTVRLNHGAGITVNAGSRVIGNKSVHNGQLGIGGGHGLGALVEGNEIAYNNIWAGFDHGWEGGGTKWALTDGLVVRGNWSHHNRGPGLWTDIDNIRTTYEDNLVEDNYSAGIFHEISYDAVIRNNVVRRNGAGHAVWGYGAGIQISASSNVTITGNLLERNARGITLLMQRRGNGAYGPYEIANNTVTGNTLVDSGWTGLFQDIGDRTYFTSKNNRFTANHYTLGADTRPFVWMDGTRTPTEWRGYGQDTTGTFK